MKERYEAVLGYLKMQGLASSAAEIAKKVGTKGANISQAKNGSMPEESALRLLHRINAAYGNPFSPTYLMTGEGRMLANEDEQAPAPQPERKEKKESESAQFSPSDFMDILRKSQAQIDALINQQHEFLKLSTMFAEQNSALLKKLSIDQ